MDVISLIYESLQIVYSFIPKELLIIILAYLFVMVISTLKEERNSAEKNN